MIYQCLFAILVCINLQQSLELLIKNILAGSAYKFINQFAALKEQNSRNIPHAELCCNFIILFNIALTDNDFPIVIIS